MALGFLSRLKSGPVCRANWAWIEGDLEWAMGLPKTA